MLRAVFFMILAVLLTGPLHAQAVVAEPFPPAKISSLYIESDDNKGSIVSIQLQGDTLIYQTTQGGKVVENAVVHPTGDDWFTFIQSVNTNARLYKWAPKYYYPGQGPSWVVDIVMEDRKFNSAGTNEYPLQGNEANPQANPKSGPSVPFQLFWQAALTLAGKAPPAAK
jgi:hypothetical protein